MVDGGNEVPRLLTRIEFANFWRVSAKTIDEWIAVGKLVEGVDFTRTPGGKLRFYQPLRA